MLLLEVTDLKLLMKRPRNAISMRSKGVDKPLFKVQKNRAKTFKHFISSDNQPNL